MNTWRVGEVHVKGKINHNRGEFIDKGFTKH